MSIGRKMRISAPPTYVEAHTSHIPRSKRAYTHVPRSHKHSFMSVAHTDTHSRPRAQPLLPREHKREAFHRAVQWAELVDIDRSSHGRIIRFGALAIFFVASKPRAPRANEPCTFTTSRRREEKHRSRNLCTNWGNSWLIPHSSLGGVSRKLAYCVLHIKLFCYCPVGDRMSWHRFLEKGDSNYEMKLVSALLRRWEIRGCWRGFVCN